MPAREGLSPPAVGRHVPVRDDRDGVACRPQLIAFLGLGIQPPQTSLGRMLGEGRNSIATAWRLGIPAGVVIFLTTLSVSLLGDRLRGRLDPTLKTVDL